MIVFLQQSTIQIVRWIPYTKIFSAPDVIKKIVLLLSWTKYTPIFMPHLVIKSISIMIFGLTQKFRIPAICCRQSHDCFSVLKCCGESLVCILEQVIIWCSLYHFGIFLVTCKGSHLVSIMKRISWMEAMW